MPYDARTDLEHLPDSTLFDISRNESAAHGEVALRILVERGSLYVARDEIASAARQLVIDNPAVLKRIDPASAVHALKLPGVIDVLSDLQAKRIALTGVVAEHNAAHTQSIEALGSAVNENKVSSEQALREAYTSLWEHFTQAQASQKLDFDVQIAALQSQHAKDMQATNDRLALLERSLWRKLADALKIGRRVLVASMCAKYFSLAITSVRCRF
jgi:hypothetical protein